MHITGEKFSLYMSANEVCLTAYTPLQAHGQRGDVSDFSRGSKSRMMRFLNSLIFDKFSFVTLTYRYLQDDIKSAYRDLRAWHKGMVYDCEPCAVVWKQELQKRGAIHYHLFLLDAPKGWAYAEIRDHWLQTTGQRGDTAARKYGVQVKTFDTMENSQAGIICAYMAKYATKDGKTAHGRAWGCLGRKYARQAEARTEISELQACAVFELFEQNDITISKADGGALYSRVYRGHLGRVAGNTRGDRLFESVKKICGVVE
jgi:hypothetical protein